MHAPMPRPSLSSKTLYEDVPQCTVSGNTLEMQSVEASNGKSVKALQLEAAQLQEITQHLHKNVLSVNRAKSHFYVTCWRQVGF